MLKLFKKFRADDSGAVTVDWVVLTAAVIALAGVAYSQIRGNTETLATTIAEQIEGVNSATGLTGAGASIIGSPAVEEE